jgi:hypothetical protein
MNQSKLYYDKKGFQSLLNSETLDFTNAVEGTLTKGFKSHFR